MCAWELPGGPVRATGPVSGPSATLHPPADWWTLHTPPDTGQKSPSMALVQHACGQGSTSAGFALWTQPCSLLLWRPPGPSWAQAPTAQRHWLQKTATCLPSLLAHQVQTSSSLAKSASFSAVQWPIHTFSRELRTPSKFVLLWGPSLSPRVP